MAAAERPPPPSLEAGANDPTPPSPRAPPPPRRAVLLFYCYSPLRDDDNNNRARLAEWYRAQCATRGLYGRVRVALDGVNVTLGGDERSLRALVDAHACRAALPPGLAPERLAAVDFKLQLCDDGEDDDDESTPTTDFCPAKGVRVRVVDELVTFGQGGAGVPEPLAPRRARDEDDDKDDEDGNDHASAASPFPTHLSPRQFHAFLEAARDNGGRDPRTGDAVVLLDARNLYETALGRFLVPGVLTLDPRTRSLAELPGWIDAHERLLARRTVLAYCTGGVRCERAAAMLRARGEGFERVAQLEGGVQRYLEEMMVTMGGAGAGGAGGGFFEGVNFVFDSRGHVGPSGRGCARGEDGGDDGGDGGDGDETAAAGSAAAAAAGAGVASPQPGVGRCAACGGPGASYGARRRCAHCRMLLPLCPPCGGAPLSLPPCALCAERRCLPAEPSSAPTPVVGRRAPLRILCLHGFRSTAGQLRARLRPLERALEGLAELCFVDAPHALPLWYRPLGGLEEGGQDGPPAPRAAAKPLPPPFPKRAWLASARVLEAAGEAARSGAPSRWEPAPAWLQKEEEEEEEDGAVGGDGAARDRSSSSSASILPRGAAARQDRGWPEAVAAIARAASEAGAPRFDGALGFSQGAAVIAGLLALRQQRQQQQQRCGGGGTDDAGDDGDERAACAAVGRFAILVCGFAPAAPRPLSALEAVAAAAAASSPRLLQVPSLHVFPDGCGHACVPGRASWALARLFEPSERAVLRLAPPAGAGRGNSGGGGGSGGGEAAAVAPSERGSRGGGGGGGGGAQMLPVTAPRIARVRQFLLDVVLAGEDEVEARRAAAATMA